MDAFYASVEQRDHPEWRGKPLVVGGDHERGVIATASYEARQYGIHSAMPSVTAKRRCPHLIFAAPDFVKYKAVSQQIREVFYEYTDLVEPLSLDEAFLDVTMAKKGQPSATLIAKAIKNDIKIRTGLIASAGVSYCKFLAKVASDVDKPDGIFVITPEQAAPFLDQLEVKRFFGIGKVTAEKLHKMGIYKGADLKQLEQQYLIRQFGKAGLYFYQIVRGIDERPVEASRERKSLGAERTFGEDYTDLQELTSRLLGIEEELWQRLVKANTYGRTLTLKIKFADFEQMTRSHSIFQPIRERCQLHRLSVELLKNESPFEKGIRLLGLTISNFDRLRNENAIQLILDF